MENPSRSIYVELKEGKFYRQPLPGDSPDDLHMVQRGSTTSEMTHLKGLSGKITSISTWTRESNEGTAYNIMFIQIDDIGESRTIKLFLDSQPARDIVDRLPNLPLSDQLNIFPWRDDKGLDRIAIASVDGQYYKSAYSKTNPGDKPKWFKTDNGWDRSALLHWMKTQIAYYNEKCRGNAN